MDEIRNKFIEFERMKREKSIRKGAIKKLEDGIRKKLEEPTQRVEVFEARNRIQFVDRNVMRVIQIYSGPVKFTIGWLDKIDRVIRQHLTQQGLLMKRGMATSRLYMNPDDMGMGLKCCVGVYLLEQVRILLQYKWGTIFRSEWFWRMEEMTKREKASGSERSRLSLRDNSYHQNGSLSEFSCEKRKLGIVLQPNRRR